MRSLSIALLTNLAATGTALLAGYGFLENQLATRPPIAVIDYEPIANALALGASTNDIQPFLSAIKRRAAAYQEAGYVVINSASIDAAPEDVFVPALDNLPEAWLEVPADPTASNEAHVEPSDAGGSQ